MGAWLTAARRSQYATLLRRKHWERLARAAWNAWVTFTTRRRARRLEALRVCDEVGWRLLGLACRGPTCAHCVALIHVVGMAEQPRHYTTPSRPLTRCCRSCAPCCVHRRHPRRLPPYPRPPFSPLATWRPCPRWPFPAWPPPPPPQSRRLLRCPPPSWRRPCLWDPTARGPHGLSICLRSAFSRRLPRRRLQLLCHRLPPRCRVPLPCRRAPDARPFARSTCCTEEAGRAPPCAPSCAGGTTRGAASKCVHSSSSISAPSPRVSVSLPRRPLRPPSPRSRRPYCLVVCALGHAHLRSRSRGVICPSP